MKRPALRESLFSSCQSLVLHISSSTDAVIQGLMLEDLIGKYRNLSNEEKIQINMRFEAIQPAMRERIDQLITNLALPLIANPRIFISYSHDSTNHVQAVRNLANGFISEGLDCHIDSTYETSPPPEGWPTWAQTQIESADYVIAVCTQDYLHCFNGDHQCQGYGAVWEAKLIKQYLYDARGKNTKVIPVGFSPRPQIYPFIPVPLRSTNYYHVSDEAEYNRLFSHLTSLSGTRTNLDVARQSQPQLPDLADLAARSVTPNSKEIDSQFAIEPTVLRELLTRMLDHSEIGVLWFDMFEMPIDDQFKNAKKDECVIGLLERTKRYSTLPKLISLIKRHYPHVLRNL